MVHNKLPRGAKQTSEWVEVSSESISTGYNFDEITRVTYKADIEYPNGNSKPFVMTAQLVEIYYKGKREWRKAFYGETSDSDARRLSQDALGKIIRNIDSRVAFSN